MKSLLRNTVFYAIALTILPNIIGGVTIEGGIPTILWGGFALTLLFMFIKPVLTIISLPLNIATLGLFSMITNATILYLMTIFVTSIAISSYVYPGNNFAGFIIPRMEINVFFAHILSAITLSVIVSFFTWITS
jgi:putative membrane protein